MKNKTGTPIKHTWLRELQVGELYDFQDTVKVNTARCLCYQYGFESGKKFSVSAKNRTITRIK